MKDKWGTRKVYIETRKKIETFDAGATFQTINVEWLSKFENWMKGNGNGVNYIGKQLRNIRAVFNYAIDNEITTNYPFRRFKIKKEETVKRSLSIEELRELMNYDVEEYQKKYRDIFMLMFYLMGINAVDLFNLPPLKGDRIIYHRAKTNRLYEIKVEPEAMEIIQRYRGENYMLDVLDTYKNYLDFLHHLNTGIQKIGDMKRVGRGGKKEINPRFPGISSYWSRHTWATIAAGLDIPKETIAAALGHSSNSVTDIYIKFDKKKIDEANRKVIDYVLDKKQQKYFLFYFEITEIFPIFEMSNKTSIEMKYKEFHRKITKAGWKFSHAEGSHYFYKKDGILSQPVPYHGANEIPEPLRRKIAREMGIK